jgi:hypothetical protein
MQPNTRTPRWRLVFWIMLISALVFVTVLILVNLRRDHQMYERLQETFSQPTPRAPATQAAPPPGPNEP